MMSHPGSPRTSMRPHGPGLPIPAPIWSLLHFLFAGRSARLGLCPSRVCMTRTPACRAAASTRLSGSMGARVSETSYPIWWTYPPSPQKSTCMSIKMSAVEEASSGEPHGHAYGRLDDTAHGADADMAEVWSEEGNEAKLIR